MTPVGQPLVLEHVVLPQEARLWGAGRPAYPDEPPAPAAVEIGVRAWRDLGVDVVVSLIEDWEVPRRAPALFEAVAERGIRLIRFPVADFGTPTDVAAFAALLSEVGGQLARGEDVLVHCNAGLGRTAVVLASLLRAHGFAGDAVQEIRRIYRPGAMETPIQEAFVRDLAVAQKGGTRTS